MGSQGRLLFDLNEFPLEEEKRGDRDLLQESEVFGYQPFTRSKVSQGEEDCPEDASSLSSKANVLGMKSAGSQIVEREEGEWSDAEGSDDVNQTSSSHEKCEISQGLPKAVGSSASVLASEDVKDTETNNQSSNSECVTSKNGENCKGDKIIDRKEPETKQREIKGIEGSRALKCSNNFGKRKMDERKEAMLGKKRARQTMFLNLEDVKQASRSEMSTSRRQKIPQPIINRTVKEASGSLPSPDVAMDKQIQSSKKPKKQVGVAISGDSPPVGSVESKLGFNGDFQSGMHSRTRRPNGMTDNLPTVVGPPILKQSSQKLTETRQFYSQPASKKPVLVSQSSVDTKLGNKKLIPLKKPIGASSQYHDTSVERLIREVTNEKLWCNTEEAELQCVPGQFESVEEYVRVFEPLLFEECRAQLNSTWEELAEANIGMKVCIKSVERRDRGWYDAVFLPASDYKLAFKEGDVAVLSAITPESGRVAGTIRRHIPVDTRDPHGAILHFFVRDFSSKFDDDRILKKLQSKCVWHLTMLGSLATVQREYVALHAFSRLHSQMQTAILNPGPEQFPKYKLQKPMVPDCFTPKFVDHLHKSFNGPQLAAIQWAAMHTAVGTNSVLTKKQDPWPFTLVQGPPGTGKTHTVWGMLNVIHLVQYQHYYTSLLQKLAPESYKQFNEINSDNTIIGSSIDEVLRNMDQNLGHSLAKLCLKPRMLVCAPSNAATDELLSRVLDRGFIDGEMKVYRPDVARVGVDSQTRAAQAVSVERRAEQLLVMSREEVLGHMHNLQGREAVLSQQITWLKRQLNAAAAVLHSSTGLEPNALIAQEQNRDRLLQNLAAAVESRYKVIVEISRLVIVESKFRACSNFNLEEARANLEASFADEAEIVFTTVSSSGRKLFSRLRNGFDMVVIDEAAQASEVAVLPPLSLGAARCVLVGDPQQLPATVISKAAGTLLYSRSLFERFQQAGCPTILLSVQYRMHPQIRDFPSRYFYQGRLTDSETVAKLPDEIYYHDPLLRPYVFFDVSHGRESHRGGSVSYENVDEARFCIGLYMHLRKTLSSSGAAGKVSVGMITPYKLQLKCLKQEFSCLLGHEEMKDVYINTVDAFQGQERDVIIMSCVRASRHGVGFVADVRRMNVALTRARRALWVMGNANALMQSDDWAALIDDAKNRKCFMDMESLPRDFAIPKVLSTHDDLGKPPPNCRGVRPVGPRNR